MRLLVLFLAVAALVLFLIGFFRWDERLPINATAGGLFCTVLAGLLHFGEAS
jgi:hypothetical protein